METQELEVFATDSNYAVIKPPGRNYPGCIIQGDTLANLCRTAKRIADFAHARKIDDEDGRDKYCNKLSKVMLAQRAYTNRIRSKFLD